MSEIRAAVITFPGSNCDRDLAVAFERFFGTPPLRVWHAESSLPPLDVIGVPGGFAYGDYLRAGAIAARAPVMREVVRLAGRGVAVLGVCNGFQVLTEAGLLPGALIRNAGLAFVCRQVALRVAARRSPFTSACDLGATLRMPVAHHDGNFIADADLVRRLEDEDRIVLRYLDNPNGSISDIAGILGDHPNVMGLMPHPERATEAELGSSDGALIFRSLLESLG